ncbi:hypothetical protein BDBG_04346 [Blastomyces gilchristii SLH14081]|uniref:Uncharacterized protein n=1 Tax=Blastomyces gilchristii (strain SLH14081) TaxID=559298 RepID=A0A179UKH6_BLAGS|nr:uncharacterized protein BDBG_04346 [Blastomyces gilchristii SLH14081]OAT08390.1 hypothetical protein BDBG_04346 [Blastomyces gilchristii SLH14081]
MQNLSEGLLEAVRKVAEITELELKLFKQQLAFTADQAFTMKSFTDTIAIINKNRENQVLGLQREIECLHRQVTTLNLKISPQLFTTSSEAYTSSEITAQDENLTMKYIKLRDLLKPSSFNDN